MELVLENIKKAFGNKEVLNGASFTFEKGTIYGLLGKNGAGKTTLFNCLAKEVNMDDGCAYVLDREKKQELGFDNLAFVFSTAVLPEFLTGYEFIRFFMAVNRDKIDPHKTIDEYFELIRLEERDRHILIKDYSLGMKNKLQMLMFIITKPAVILLDEPLTSLDVIMSLEMKKLLLSICKDHIIIFSTHILQLAKDLCDEIVILHNGTLEKLDNDLLSDNKLEEELFKIFSEE